MAIESAARLTRLLHLASPLLPVGAYSYSQGLEAAIANGWVVDETSAGEWIVDVLAHVVGRVEAPIFLRLSCVAANRDGAGFAHWNEWFIASRETRELRAETIQMGHALAALAATLAPEVQALFAACERLSYPAGFAAFAAALGIPGEEALVAYLWAFAENQVAAAMKTVPLGQTAGQRLLVRLQQVCVDVCRSAARIADDDIGSAGLAFALASCKHETLYTRLFRS